MKDFFSLFSPSAVFKNTGRTLQNVAKFFYGCAVALAILCAFFLLIFLFLNDGTYWGTKLVLLIIVPPSLMISGWASSVFIYGFGVIVDKCEEKEEPAVPAHPARPTSSSSDDEKIAWAPALVSKSSVPAATPVSKPAAPVPPPARPTQSSPRATAPWVCPVCDRHNNAQVLVCACGKHQPR